MENKNLSIKVQNLTKEYRIFDSPLQRIKYLLFPNKKSKSFVALKNINFIIEKGVSYAIIGKNGSGKSTLLQVLAGIIKPTVGEVEINGKVVALLELGSGFDPESTGYENIYMNAAILGVAKKEIDERIKDIIEFADIGEHIHQPIKTYSSGMYVRLAFSVAINTDADILLIDEALAVGDVFFRQKCYARLNELKERGVTIILVTHNMSEVEQFCDKALLLSRGKQILTGSGSEVVKVYYVEDKKGLTIVENDSVILDVQEIEFSNNWKIKENVFVAHTNSKEITNGQAEYRVIGLFDKHGKVRRSFQQGETAYFYSEIKVNKDIQYPICGIAMYNQRNLIIHGKNTAQTDAKIPNNVKKGSIVCMLQTITLDVEEGEYTIEYGFSTIDDVGYMNRNIMSQEEQDSHTERLCVRNNAASFSVSAKKENKPNRNPFYGMCELEGSSEIIIK
ncbi:MAG: ABC transporter ATP-binding protein [Eubacteriales bacterium]